MYSFPTAAGDKSVFVEMLGGGQYVVTGVPVGNAILFEAALTLIFVLANLLTVVDRAVPHTGAALAIGVVAVLGTLIG